MQQRAAASGRTVFSIQRIGGVLGPWPPIVVARWFESSSLLRLLCQLVYMLLPVELAVVQGLSFRERPQAHPALLIAVILLPLLAYPLYVALPLVGLREAWRCLDAALAFPPGAQPERRRAPRAPIPDARS